MTLEEDRVFDDQAGKVDVLVACDAGVVSVAVSGDRVGRFGMEHRSVVRDVATDGDRLAVATDEDVLGDEFEPTGFGPAVAVAVDDDRVVAAGENGRVARRDAGDEKWTELGRVEEVRAIDGSLVAAADGVSRIEGDELRHAGLTDVRDVSARRVPLAATGDGLYKLGNGWMDDLPDAFDSVSVAADGRALAAGERGVVARGHADGDWVDSPVPVDERVVGVAHAPGVAVAVTEAGTLLLDDGEGRRPSDSRTQSADGWRSRALGLRDVSAVAVR
jgi:hypothetical protein